MTVVELLLLMFDLELREDGFIYTSGPSFCPAFGDGRRCAALRLSCEHCVYAMLLAMSILPV